MQQQQQQKPETWMPYGPQVNYILNENDWNRTESGFFVLKATSTNPGNVPGDIQTVFRLPGAAKAEENTWLFAIKAHDVQDYQYTQDEDNKHRIVTYYIPIDKISNYAGYNIITPDIPWSIDGKTGASLPLGYRG